jgi:phage terminase small subunit
MATQELVAALPPEIEDLTLREQKFVFEYLIDLDPPAAYVRAGYSDSSPGGGAYELLKKPTVKAAISRAQLAQLQKINITAQTVLEAVAQIAFVDPRSLFGADGNILPMKDWPEGTARALSALDVERRSDGVSVAKIRFWDKISALQLLAKHLNLLEKDDREKGALEIRWLDE